MKNLSGKLLILILLLAGNLSAQDFEGTIKYSLKLNLPEKERKQMEQMQQMGYGMMMPTGFEITAKNPVSRIKMLGSKGVMMEIASQHDKKENYLLDHAGKKAYKLPAEMAASNTDSKPKVTKTTETQTIAGYKCTKYLVEEPGKKTVQQVWACKDIKIPLSAFSGGFGTKSSQSMMIEGVEGLPLKMTVSENGSTSEVVATEIKKAKVNAADLQVPGGYTIEPFDAAVIGKMMMSK